MFLCKVNLHQYDIMESPETLVAHQENLQVQKFIITFWQVDRCT